MNFLMCAAPCDSKGKVRYFMGAQIDVSGFILDDVRTESMKELSKEEPPQQNGEGPDENGYHVNGDGDGTNGLVKNTNGPTPTTPKKAARPGMTFWNSLNCSIRGNLPWSESTVVRFYSRVFLAGTNRTGARTNRWKSQKDRHRVILNLWLSKLLFQLFMTM
jgi:hypothetical protein